MTFGLVGQKLVWVDFASKTVHHICLDDFGKKEAAWVNSTCFCFSVDEFLTNLSSEDFKLKGVQIDEIGGSSMLRQKLLEQHDDKNMCLMQLTAGSNAIVYNLMKNHKAEITLLSKLELFKDPVIFSSSGFELSTKNYCFQTNSAFSLGVRRPCAPKGMKGVFKQFAEIDMEQLEHINNFCKKEKRNQSRT